MSMHPIGYVALLRRNQVFRRLWYGQVISQFGDWFDAIALYALLWRLTGSGQVVGALLVAQFLPATVVGLWAGVIIDRLPRRVVLIAADVGRALVVALLLFVHDGHQIWLVYAVTVLKVMLTAFFEPARTAIIPNVAVPEELLAANGISGTTWSAMLAIGAGLGGLVAGTLGAPTAFIIDSASFLISAVLIASVPIHESHHAGRPTVSHRSDLRAGWRFLLSQRDIALYALSKALWHVGGGVMLLLTIVARQVFPLGSDGALSIGLFYAARGIGAGLGPLLAQRLGRASMQFLRRTIGPAFFLSAVGYAIFGSTSSLLLAACAVVCAHIGASIQWVSSTTLLQLRVPNQFQGRVFGAELALLTLTSAVSNYTIGVATDRGWSPQALALALALAFLLAGMLLTLVLWREPDRQIKPAVPLQV
jgi:MFS family permease